MGTQLLTPEQLSRLLPPIVQRAHELTLTDTDDYDEAAYFLKHLAERRRQIDEVFDPIVRKAHEAHKEAVSQKKKFEIPILEAEQLVKTKMGTFRVEQERIRRAEEERLREEARVQQVAAAEEVAKQLEVQGEPAAAELVREQAEQAPPPVVVLPSAVPKHDGVSKRQTWKYRVVDEKAVPREYLKIDEVKLGQVVRATKGSLRIPGVEVYCDESVSVRSR